MPLNTEQILQDRYRIDALLGQGGMGAVYRGTDLRFNASVAIKENRMVTPESQKQFAREAGLLYRLRHPNLPRVIDYFTIADQGQYLVMDFIAGEDLQQVLARKGPVSQPQALGWIGQILDALVYLHKQSIIHRDVKPANVKITPEGQVFLVDFGLAKVYDPLQQTTMGARGVTPGYAPPEQYGHGRTDARTDVYSAGATLYALLTGQKPPDALEYVTGQAHLDPPRALNPNVSPHVEAAILCALQTRPDDRYQTAAELRAALLDDGPAPERPDVAPQVLPQQVTRLAEPGRRARIAELLPQAWAAFNRADWHQAAANSAEVLALEPQNAEADRLLERARTAQQIEQRYAEGTAALDAMDWQEAVTALEDVVALDATYGDARAMLEQAREELAREQHKARLRLKGQEALQAGQWSIAIERLEEYLALQPGATDAQADLERARQGAEEEQQAAAHFKEAQAHFDRSEWEPAIQAAEQSLSLRPDTAEYRRLLKQAQAQRQEEKRARREAEQEAREKRARETRLARQFSQAQQIVEYAPDRAISLLGEIRREAPDYPGLADLRRKAQDAQLAWNIRRQEEKRARRQQLQRNAAMGAGVLAIIVVAVLAIGAIRDAALKRRAEGHYEAALAAFDTGQWDEGRAELEAMSQIETKKTPIDDMHRTGLDYGIEAAVRAQAWQAASDLMLGRSQLGVRERSQDLNDLLVRHPQLRQSLYQSTGSQVLGWTADEMDYIAFSLGGETLLVGGSGQAQVWNVDDRTLQYQVEDGWNWSLSPDGTKIASSWLDTITVRDIQQNRVLGHFATHEGRVYELAFSPDSILLATSQGDVWNTITGELQYTLADRTSNSQNESEDGPSLGTSRNESIAFSPDGSLLAATSYYVVGLWRTSDGTLMRELGDGKVSTIDWLRFSPDGTTVAYGKDDEVLVWRVYDGSLVTRIEEQAAGSRAAYSPDGQWLATCSSGYRGGYEIQVWHIEDGTLAQTLGRGAPPLAFSPNSKLLFAGSGQGAGFVTWQISDGTEWQTLNALVPANRSVYSLSPDGHSLAMVSIYSTYRESEGQVIETVDSGLVQVWSLDTGSWTTPRASATEVAAAPTGVPDPTKTETPRPDPTATGTPRATVIREPTSTVLSPTASPSPPPRLGQIVFVSKRDGNHEVYIMGADGTEETRLTKTDDRERHPEWSPDGQQIAFRSGSTGGGDIYLMYPDGTDLRRLTQHPDYDDGPSWSPDGRRIAFFSKRGRTQIYVMNADGTDQTEVSSGTYDWAPSWSPDGTRIVYVSDANPHVRIAVKDLDSGEVAYLTDSTYIDRYPDWSPDGKLIAFESDRDGDMEIYVMAPDGSGLTQLTHNDTWDGHPSWSPYGQYIAFEANRNDNVDIYVMDVAGSWEDRLTESPEADYAPSWSQPTTSQQAQSSATNTPRPPTATPEPPIKLTGRLLVWAKPSGSGYQDEEIFVMDADGSNLTKLTENMATDWWPSWSPDNKRIAFSSVVNGKSEIYTMSSSGGSLTRLTENLYSDDSPTWSPDGKRFAFASDRPNSAQDRNYEIYLMSNDGSGVVQLTANQVSDKYPDWSSTGRIAFASVRDDPDPQNCRSCNYEIYAMAGDGRDLVRLTEGDAEDIHPAWSPNGDRLAFVSDDNVHVMNADGSDRTAVTIDLNVHRAPTWSPDGKYIAFVSRGDILVMRADGSGLDRLVKSLKGIETVVAVAWSH